MGDSHLVLRKAAQLPGEELLLNEVVDNLADPSSRLV